MIGINVLSYSKLYYLYVDILLEFNCAKKLIFSSMHISRIDISICNNKFYETALNIYKLFTVTYLIKSKRLSSIPFFDIQFMSSHTLISMRELLFKDF